MNFLTTSDFHALLEYEIKEKHALEAFMARFQGDLSLKYSVSDRPVTIAENALFEGLSGPDSIESIFNESDSKNNEIPFTIIIDEDSLVIKAVYRGMNGNSHCCDWDKGDLLQRSYQTALQLNAKVGISHTHPIVSGISHTHPVINLHDQRKSREYGAVPSSVMYNLAELNRNNPVQQKILESKIYQEFGVDYCQIHTRQQLKPDLISKYAMILSPRLRQIGVFEVLDKGRIIYHPLKLEE